MAANTSSPRQLSPRSCWSGCTAVIDQASFFPQAVPPPATALEPPPGYVLTEAMLDLPDPGIVHAVRLDRPASETGGTTAWLSPPPALPPLPPAYPDPYAGASLPTR